MKKNGRDHVEPLWGDWGQLGPAPDTVLTVQDWARAIKTQGVHLDQLRAAAQGLLRHWAGLELHPQNTKVTAASLVS